MAPTKKKILVTSALPYANGPIHIGHLVEYIQTDIFVRFLKLIGEKAIYCCADDTHGTPIEINASKQGITPEELIAKYHKEHQQDFAAYLINFDNYYTTNSPENKEYADLIFLKLKENGHIYTKEVEQAYCEKDKRFLPDRYVKGTCPKCGAEDQYGDVCEKCNSTYTPLDLINPRCTLCGSAPVRRKSKHYFFRLSSFSEKLRNYITGNPHLQKEVKNHVLKWIDAGLEDWDISRDGPYFGFKIPGEEDKYYYVWLDAPIGYIASAKNYCDKNNESIDDYWKNGRVIHFIGKDIVYFHLLFWPAVLMGSGFALPENVVVHGFLTVNGEKMSKSRGTFLTAREFLDYVNPEHLRFYYARSLAKTTSDIDLDLADFKSKVNNELVANIANFFYRTLSFLQKHFNGSTGDEFDDEILAKAKSVLSEAGRLFGQVEFREATMKVLEAGSLGNKYFQEKEPWKLVREDKKECLKVLSTCLTMAAWLNTALKPVLPLFTERIEEQLNLKSLAWEDIGRVFPNHKTSKAEIVLKKIEKDIELGKSEWPLDLRVAEITDVAEHPDADKLYVLKIDLGSEQRQLVAGLRGHYSGEELLGKRIVVVANLQKARIRGVESQGMLLAAEGDGRLGLLLAPHAEPGAFVAPKGAQPSKEEITIDKFLSLGLKVENGSPVFKGEALSAEGKKIVVDRNIEKGKIR